MNNVKKFYKDEYYMATDYKEYYEFDDISDEVIFHRHDMPSPWMNYLTNGTFFTMISQATWNFSPVLLFTTSTPVTRPFS